MEQLILHLLGDYILQNDYLAMAKKNKGLGGFISCFTHCLLYSIPFGIYTRSWIVGILIGVSHFALDRTTVVTKFLMIRNGVKDSSNFGFHPDRPKFISVWLYIITDNCFHIIGNYFIILMYYKGYF